MGWKKAARMNFTLNHFYHDIRRPLLPWKKSAIVWIVFHVFFRFKFLCHSFRKQWRQQLTWNWRLLSLKRHHINEGMKNGSWKKSTYGVTLKQNNSTESIEAWVTSSATNQLAFKPGESKNLVRNSNSNCCLYYIKSAEQRKHSQLYNLFHLGTIVENNTLSALGSSLEFICKAPDKTI